MNREYYLELAKKGQRMIFGTGLILEEKPDYSEILNDGKRLGEIFVEAADRFKCPVALPLMDLSIEKSELLNLLGITEKDVFRFNYNLSDEIIEKLKDNLDKKPIPRLKSLCDAICYVKQNSGLIPVGMLIGPFSLMTKLLVDPIVPVFLAASGISGEEDPGIKNVEILLELAVIIIKRSAKLQIDAGAELMCVCEPAANMAFISPDLLTEDNDIFDKYVISYNKQIVDLLNDNNVNLFLHDCGELSDIMLKKLCRLNPVILSLGSSRKLWEDAQVVPENIILFGNISTKYLTTVEDNQFNENIDLLLNKMPETGHPYILGSECDILSITGYEKILYDKAMKILTYKK